MSMLRAVWETNPVRVTAIIASIVVFAATQLHVVLGEASVVESLGLVLPILLGGEAARSKVSPHPGEIGPDNDELLPDEVA